MFCRKPGTFGQIANTISWEISKLWEFCEIYERNPAFLRKVLRRKYTLHCGSNIRNNSYRCSFRVRKLKTPRIAAATMKPISMVADAFPKGNPAAKSKRKMSSSKHDRARDMMQSILGIDEIPKGPQSFFKRTGSTFPSAAESHTSFRSNTRTRFRWALIAKKNSRSSL